MVYPDNRILTKIKNNTSGKMSIRRNSYSSCGSAGHPLKADCQGISRLNHILEKEKYQAIFEYTSDVIFILDNNGNIVDVNRRIEEVGYSKEQFIGRNIRSLEHVVTEKSLVNISRNFDRRMSGTEIPPYEIEIINKHQETQIFTVNTRLIKHHGDIIGEIAFLHDVTSWKKIEQTLKDSENKLRNYLESAPDGVYISDLQGQFIYGNGEAEKIIGYKKEELIGKSFLNTGLLQKNDIERAIQLLLNNSKGEKTGPDEFLLTRKDGSTVWAEINTTPIKQNGETHIIGFVRDVSKRRETEQNLQQIEIVYRTLFEQSNEAIYISSREGRFIEVNNSMLKLFDYSKEEMLSMDIKQIYLNPEERDNFCRIIEKKGFVKDYEIKFVKKDGTVINCLLNSTLRLADDWSILGYQGIIHDITERKLSEEKLRISHEKLEKMVEGAVNAIATMAEMRDPYTAGHQRRVAKLAMAIAEEMGFEKTKCEIIRIAATLHDIGKTYIPAEILSKPGSLSNMEMNMIRTHPQVSREILKSLELPWPICQIVLQHHERIDGSGYPNNLKGDEITIEARILAVADVVEAMASHRPYRPSLGIQKALDEISKNSGILYDKAVVDACLKLFREKDFKFEQ